MRLWRSLLLSWLLELAGRVWGDVGPVHDFEGYQNGVYGNPPEQTFKDANITSPIFNINTNRPNLLAPAPGATAGDGSSHIFLTLAYNGSGPYIFRNDDLSLVYAAPEFDYAMNARVQTVNGSDYLTFWHGARNQFDSQGFCVFYDQQYQLAFNVTLASELGVNADMHECEVTDDGTVLLTAYLDKEFDLTALGGKEEDVLADSCFQEVDILTNEALFQWCASDLFEPGLGYWNFSGPSRRRDGYTTSEGFDAYHVNSLQKTKEGNYLVSLRNLKTLIYINGSNGEPIWNLGGKINDFEDVTPSSVLDANPGSESALNFGWQHDARFIDEELTWITLLDNHELINAQDCQGSSCSRGRLLQINTSNPENPTVQLLRDYRSPQGLGSVIFGSMQVLGGQSDSQSSSAGSVLIGWGVSPEFGEFTFAGELVRDVQYARIDPEHSHSGSITSYRAYKQSWHGHPTWPPELAIDEEGTLFVSWNGATEVHTWAVYGTNRPMALGRESGTESNEASSLEGMYLLKTTQRQGFETKIEHGGRMSAFVKVAALNAQGEVIGTTRTLKTGVVPSASSCLLQDTMSFTCLIRLLV